MCVCVCVCIYIYIYRHIYIYSYIFIYVYILIHMYIIRLRMYIINNISNLKKKCLSNYPHEFDISLNTINKYNKLNS